MTSLIKRFAVDKIREALGDTRVVVIQGARQVGKSTLAQHIVGFGDRYVTLDEPSELAAAEGDTYSYVEQARNGCLIISPFSPILAASYSFKICAL
ncbi:MAG: AAA family ATPase [Ferrimicrobium sp.]